MSTAVRDDDVASYERARGAASARAAVTGIALRTASGESPSAPDRPGTAAVYRAIRSAILSGMLAPGQRLVEEEICVQVGARRHSARQALRQLSDAGLVVLRPNRSAQVRRITSTDTSELLELLVPVQALAAGLAATRRRSTDIRALAVLVESSAAAASGLDSEELLAANRAFYLHLAAASRNSSVSETVDRLLSQLSLARPHPLLRRESGEIVAHHRALFEAVRDRRPDAAESAATRWLRSLAPPSRTARQ